MGGTDRSFNVLYVLAPSPVESNSVQRKVRNQMKALRAQQVEVKGLFITATDHPPETDDTNILFHASGRSTRRFFRSIHQTYLVHRALMRCLKDMVNDETFIYFRFPKNNLFLWRFARQYKGRYFFEHVTNELDELRLNESLSREGGFISRLLGRSEFYHIPRIAEYLFGRLVRQNALFGLCNSEEIADYQNQLARGGYRTIVQGDAVGVQNIKPKGDTPFTDEFRMIFLKGSSSRVDYNGIDRVLRGIANYKGKFNLRFFLFGNQLEEERAMVEALGIEASVELGPAIGIDDQDRVFDSIHLGISALAVHRKGIRSTTTIKSREYCARGLPFIYAYDDPDIPLDWPYASQLKMNDDPIDFEEIIPWWQTTQERGLGVEMRSFAEEHLDYSVKMRNLIMHIQGSN